MFLPRAFVLSLLFVGPLQAATLNVPPGAGTLQEAIAGARPGDVLLLSAGTYGPATIDRSLVVHNGV